MRSDTSLRTRASFGRVTRLLALATAFATLTLIATPAFAVASGVVSTDRTDSPAAVAVATNEGTGSLESAAAKAGETGRKVAMSLIALGFAVASIVLAFKRDFKEAAGIFAVGLIAILLATPAGVNVLHSTVNSLFGAS
jgi:hypothetical protein